MGRWVHRITAYDDETLMATCAECGPVAGYRTETGRFGVRCGNKHKAMKRDDARTRGSKNQKARRTYKKTVGHCQMPGCVSVIIDPCQLDLDHIDGNPHNNDPSNWQVLCANCHRIKTYRPDLLPNDE